MRRGRVERAAPDPGDAISPPTDTCSGRIGVAGQRLRRWLEIEYEVVVLIVPPHRPCFNSIEKSSKHDGPEEPGGRIVSFLRRSGSVRGGRDQAADDGILKDTRPDATKGRQTKGKGWSFSTSGAALGLRCRNQSWPASSRRRARGSVRTSPFFSSRCASS